MEDGTEHPLKVRSLVGLMPLLAVTTIEAETLEELPLFRKKMDWLGMTDDEIKKSIIISEIKCVKNVGNRSSD